MVLKQKCVYNVKTIAQNITQESRTELERLRAIWVWLCDNIEYDVSGFLGQTKKLSSPEEMIAAGKGVCSGYASICLAMCREVGIECQEVSGYGKGIGHRPGQSLQDVPPNHMWNAVLLADQWFLMDACWGAGNLDMEHKSFIKKFNDFYFLTDPEDFVESHFPDEQRWQLLDQPMSREDFEKRISKTSTFFTLGLKLIQPQYFNVLTDNGEVNLSISSSRPVTYSYHITQQHNFLHRGATKQKETVIVLGLDDHVGTRTMRLQILPPPGEPTTSMVFAGPELSTTLTLVCSFTVECTAPGPPEEIPENPFHFWGLQPGAGALGVVGSSQGSQALEPDGLTRATCSARRPLLPLSVFVRDYDKAEAELENAANLLLHCKATVVSRSQLFPPTWARRAAREPAALQAGLSKFSHTGALVSTQQGKCNITFQNQQDLELLAVLERATGRQLPSGCRATSSAPTLNSKVTVSVTASSRGLPSPPSYTDWRKGCVLFEPRTGLLEPGAWVRFRVRVPGAKKVSVVGKEWAELKMNDSHVWEGEVFTGSLKQVKLVATSEDGLRNTPVLLTFDIRPSEREE
ncbi:hypothetical protein CRUP_038463 [Coryphaenoides rupestris]|nr:hypothetical protein CRUP_038463 [Coryphaenoides rupestris]